MTAPLSEERLEAIRAMLDTDPVVTVNSSLGVAALSDIEIGETGIDTIITDLLAEVDRLFAALDAEDRATLHAEAAADRLWQAYDEMQEMTLPPPYRRRTREQIVGLVPLDTTREGE